MDSNFISKGMAKAIIFPHFLMNAEIKALHERERERLRDEALTRVGQGDNLACHASEAGSIPVTRSVDL